MAQESSLQARPFSSLKEKSLLKMWSTNRKSKAKAKKNHFSLHFMNPFHLCLRFIRCEPLVQRRTSWASTLNPSNLKLDWPKWKSTNYWCCWANQRKATGTKQQFSKNIRSFWRLFFDKCSYFNKWAIWLRSWDAEKTHKPNHVRNQREPTTY